MDDIDARLERAQQAIDRAGITLGAEEWLSPERIEGMVVYLAMDRKNRRVKRQRRQQLVGEIGLTAGRLQLTSH